MSSKQEKRIRRHKKIRARIYGTYDRPRLFVFRSVQHIYAQLIDDEKAKVLLSVSDKDVHPVKSAEGGAKQFNRVKPGKKETKVNVAKEVGKVIAKKAIEKKIEKVVFDRGGVVFHGRIKALADGAREGGLKF